jgi:hypothetical protein
MEPGLFVTFFDDNEPRDRDLPPVGPLEHVVVRPGPQLIFDRTTVHQADAGVPIDRWFEAELELQRASGAEPGGTRRSQMRFASRDGIYLRFVSYGDAQETNRLAELGPFSTVVLRPREVEADGRVIATIAVADFPTWALTRAAGEGFAGAYKPDIAIRDDAAKYHPSLGPTPASSEAQPARPAAPAPVASAVAARPAESALVARDIAHVERLERERSEDTLRARIFDENRQRAGPNIVGEPAAWTPYPRARVSEPTSRATATATAMTPTEDGLSVGEILWRWRFAIIGVLLVGMVTYAAYIAIRTAAPRGAEYTTVNLAQRVSGTRWDWVVNGVRRSPDSGSVRAQGVFYVVSIAATNKGSEGAAPSPSEFALVDPNGMEHVAASLASGVYQSQDNASSPNMWPPSFPVGRPVTFSLLFDVDPNLPRGSQLAIADAPSVRVKLD